MLLTPMALPGIASTVLLSIILSLERGVLDAQPHRRRNAAPLTAFIASFPAPKACSGPSSRPPRLLAIAPILVLGWFSQQQLVRGLTFGAVK